LVACARSSLADEAYEAPVDGQIEVPVDPNAAGPDQPAEAGDSEVVPRRDDFSQQTETLCAVAACSFRNKVEIERVFEDARVSAGAEPDDVAAREALAKSFAGPGFTSTEALRYYELGDPPSDDMVAQLSRVLSAIHDVLDAGQREAVASEVAEVGPFAVLGVPRRGGFAPGERRGGKGARRADGEAPEGRGKDGPGGKKGRAGKRGQGGSAAVGADGLRTRQRERVRRLCETVECSDGQLTALTRMFAEREREDYDAEIASMNLKLALLFRAEEAPMEAVERQMRALRKMGDARDLMRAELLAGIHELLTPQQRGAAATRMQTEGPGQALGLRRGG